MKLSKKKLYKINKILPIIQTEIANANDTDYFDALNLVVDIISGKEPEVGFLEAHQYIYAVETNINHYLYYSTDINKTNALVDCADILREYLKFEPDYKIEGEDLED